MNMKIVKVKPDTTVSTETKLRLFRFNCPVCGEESIVSRAWDDHVTITKKCCTHVDFGTTGWDLEQGVMRIGYNRVSVRQMYEIAEPEPEPQPEGLPLEPEDTEGIELNPKVVRGFGTPKS